MNFFYLKFGSFVYDAGSELAAVHYYFDVQTDPFFRRTEMVPDEISYVQCD